ncbi:MAG: hypothetical protein U0793_12160 [Gemmataceae bacterium]
MTRMVKSSALVAAALWVGVLFCLGFIVAPYLFILAARNSPAVPNTGIAADLIGPLLYSSDVISLIVAALLVAALLFLRRRGEIPLGNRWFLSEAVVALAAVCAALNYWWFAPQLKAIQGELADRYGAFHRADRADPLLAQFDGLHQTSTTVFMIGLAAALVCLVCMTQFRSRKITGA